MPGMPGIDRPGADLRIGLVAALALPGRPVGVPALALAFPLPFALAVPVARGADRRGAARPGDRRLAVARVADAAGRRRHRPGRRARGRRRCAGWSVEGRSAESTSSSGPRSRSDAACEPIGGAAGEAAPLGLRETPGTRGRRSRPPRRRLRLPRPARRAARGSRAAAARARSPTAAAPPSRAAGCGAAAPRSGRSSSRGAPRIVASSSAVRARRSGCAAVRATAAPHRDRRRDRGTGRRRRRGPTGPGVRGLATRPLLERRADGERAREAVRLLVRQRARGRLGLGIAAMAVVRSVRPLVPLVLEGHERAGRGSVDAGQPSLGHRGDDTRRARRRWRARPGSAARLTCPTEARTLRAIPGDDTVKPHPQCEGVPCLA